MSQRFLSRREFDKLAASAATSSSNVEIIKWRLLENGAVFRVIDRVTIPTAEGEKMYAVLETEHREILQVWITPIINKELMKYDLSQGNVFIKPLGKRTSNTTGNDYFNFAIVLDIANSM